ncbi:MAG: hypothetical protein ACYCXQ_09865 [Candidatus Humimicrobiaceae bacterium]
MRYSVEIFLISDSASVFAFVFAALISAPGSKAKIYITPTNEEIVVTHFIKKVVEAGRDLTPEEMIFRL